MFVFFPITVPGFNTLPQPTSTLSPSIAPIFFIPVSIFSVPFFITINFLSARARARSGRRRRAPPAAAGGGRTRTSADTAGRAAERTAPSCFALQPEAQTAVALVAAVVLRHLGDELLVADEEEQLPRAGDGRVEHAARQQHRRAAANGEDHGPCNRNYV